MHIIIVFIVRILLLDFSWNIKVKLIARLAREHSVLRERAIHRKVAEVCLVALRLIDSVLLRFGGLNRMKVREAGAFGSALLWSVF